MFLIGIHFSIETLSEKFYEQTLADNSKMKANKMKTEKKYWNDIFNNFNDKCDSIKCCVLFSVVTAIETEREKIRKQLKFSIMKYSRYNERHRSKTCATFHLWILNCDFYTLHGPSIIGSITNDILMDVFHPNAQRASHFCHLVIVTWILKTSLILNAMNVSTRITATICFSYDGAFHEIHCRRVEYFPKVIIIF